MHTVILLSNHTILTCGVNDHGALGRETEGEPWDEHPSRTGTIQDSYTFQPVTLPPGHVAKQIAAGDSHSIVATEMGAVVGWGTYKDNNGVMGFQRDVRL